MSVYCQHSCKCRGCLNSNVLRAKLHSRIRRQTPAWVDLVNGDRGRGVALLESALESIDDALADMGMYPRTGGAE